MIEKEHEIIPLQEVALPTITVDAYALWDNMTKVNTANIESRRTIFNLTCYMDCSLKPFLELSNLIMGST